MCSLDGVLGDAFGPSLRSVLLGVGDVLPEAAASDRSEHPDGVVGHFEGSDGGGKEIEALGFGGLQQAATNAVRVEGFQAVYILEIVDSDV